MTQLARSQKRIHLGQLLKNLIAMLLDETPCDEKLLSFRLQLSGLQNGMDRLFLRRLDEGAGVHDHGVRLGGVRYDLMAARF